MGHEARKRDLLHANNQGAIQPAHPRSLINDIADPSLNGEINKIVTCKVSIF